VAAKTAPSPRSGSRILDGFTPVRSLLPSGDMFSCCDWNAVGERAPVSTKQIGGTAPLGTLLLQITVTLAAARTFGWFLRKIGQPSVIGEILAGVVLGPTIFGRFAPDASAFIFPSASLGTLKFLAEVGVILFHVPRWAGTRHQRSSRPRTHE
jgi:hypothetical protein